MRWEKLTVMSQEVFREAQAKAGEYAEGDTVVLGVDKKGSGLNFGHLNTS